METRMGSNQNRSAGSARHVARPAARIVGAGRSSGAGDGDPQVEYLESMREAQVHPSLQWAQIQAMEAGDEDE